MISLPGTGSFPASVAQAEPHVFARLRNPDLRFTELSGAARSQGGAPAAMLRLVTMADDKEEGRSWRRYVPLALIALALALFFGLRLDRYATLDRLVQSHAELRQLTTAHTAPAFAAFVALYALFVAISAPGATILTIAAGALFGLPLGAMAGATGATLGASALFLAAQSALGPWLAERAGPRLARLRAGFCANAWGYMLFLRLSPLFPFWFVNLAAACAGVRFRTFLWTTMVGILPASFIFSAAGAGLDHVATAALAAREACRAAGGAECKLAIPLSAIVTPQIFVVMIGLSLVA
ncbi:MAG: TVP38/TMEM64 family protein, partial [Hyphomicrobiales bacterium]|nr:TVP38/TMEM64 family protein [Hyphomicrobiales bacterium]